MRPRFVELKQNILGSLVIPRGRALHTLGTTVVVLGLGMVTSVVLARWLGPTGRGEIAAALLWPTLLIHLASVGLLQSILYHSAQPDIEPGEILGTAMTLAMLQSIPFVLIGYALLPVLLRSQRPEVIAASRLFLLTVPIGLLAQCVITILQAKMRFFAFNILRLIIPIGYVVGLFALHAFTWVTPLSVVIVQLILGTLTMLLAIATVAHMRIVERLWVSVRLGRRFLAFGGKVWVGGLSQTANVRLDQALLSGLFPAATLGLYVTATSVSGLLFVLATSVALIVTPSVANKTGQAAKRHELQRMFRKFWIMNIACAVALAAVSPLAIPLLFGEEFRGAILPALILTAGAVFLGAKEILAGAAQSLGDPWLGSRAEIAGMIAAAVLMLALLPPFGLIGAAIATAMAYLVQFAVLVRGLGTRHDIRAAALFGGRALDPVAAENRSDRGSAN